MMMARAKVRATSGTVWGHSAPSRRWICQSSGRSRVRRSVMEASRRAKRGENATGKGLWRHAESCPVRQSRTDARGAWRGKYRAHSRKASSFPLRHRWPERKPYSWEPVVRRYPLVLLCLLACQPVLAISFQTRLEKVEWQVEGGQFAG